MRRGECIDYMGYGAGARVASKSAYVVFVLPVAVSVPVAVFVMAGLADGGAGASVRLVLPETHPASEPLVVSALADPAFECGDVYIAVFGPDGGLVAQQAYFEQCFGDGPVPVGDEFSLMLDEGAYRVSVDVIDAANDGTASAVATVTVG